MNQFSRVSIVPHERAFGLPRRDGLLVVDARNTVRLMNRLGREVRLLLIHPSRLFAHRPVPRLRGLEVEVGLALRRNANGTTILAETSETLESLMFAELRSQRN